MGEIKEINHQEADAIICNPLKADLGLFLHKDGNFYVGIDNTTHDAWVEDFATRKECEDWLVGKNFDE